MSAFPVSEDIIKMERVGMENREIGLLEHFFSSAGQRQQENAKKLLHLAAERLVRAGAKEVEYHGEGSMLTFQVRLRRETQEYTSVGYRLWVMPGAEQYQLQQAALWGRDQQTAGVLRWYVRHRNEELPRGIFYRQDPVLLEGRIGIRSGWETDLVRRVGDMNRVMEEDYKILEPLGRGVVPESVRNCIREEYSGYEREMSHDVTV